MYFFLFFEKDRKNGLWGGYMMLYVIFAAAFIIIVLYFMPVDINIDVNREDNKNLKMTLGIKTLYGLLRFNPETPFLKLAFENVKEGENLYKKYGNNKFKIISVLRYIMKKIKISNFYLKLSMGTGDAAATGVLYGAAWIIIGSIMAFAKSRLNMGEPRIIVAPVFGSVRLNVDFNCIISIKSGHIINAGIRAIPALISGNREKFN